VGTFVIGELHFKGKNVRGPGWFNVLLPKGGGPQRVEGVFRKWVLGGGVGKRGVFCLTKKRKFQKKNQKMRGLKKGKRAKMCQNWGEIMDPGCALQRPCEGENS